MITKIIMCGLLVMGLTACESNSDIIVYENEKYVLLEYNADIFNYGYNNRNNEYMEVDITYPVDSEQWDMVICNGDLFVEKDKCEEASEYYCNDANYDWYFTVENEEDENTYPITLTDEEAAYIYGVEELEKETTLFFEEIEKFGILEKVSKDGIIIARMDFVLFEDNWYWKSEIIDESKEVDGSYAEYIQALPESLNQKILDMY